MFLSIIYFYCVTAYKKLVLTVGAPVCSFAHVSVRADLQVEIVQVRSGLKMDESPRVPPVGPDERRRIGSSVTGSESLESCEPQSKDGGLQHGKVRNRATHLHSRQSYDA